MPRSPTTGWLVMLAVAASCGAPEPPERWGEAWPEADALFHRDARFRGADGAYSVDLGGGRVLWMFGDTFVGRDPRDRRDSYFLRNSIAVQTGLDPQTAFLQHDWRWADGAPRSFFPEPDAEHWFWPAHGIRLDEVLLVFGEIMVNDGPPGPTSFADDHAAAYVIDNPDDDPLAWTLRPATLPSDADVLNYGGAVLAEGDFVYVYANRGRAHELVLTRFARAAAAAGDLSRAELWCGGEFRTGCEAATLIRIGMPELSIHHDERLGYVMVGTSGYGATTLSWRVAPALYGPWSDTGDLFRPPESFTPGAFVYAGKAHPMLDGGGDLVATYVPSSFVALPRETDERFYFPRFVRLHPR